MPDVYREAQELLKVSSLLADIYQLEAWVITVTLLDFYAVRAALHYVYFDHIPNFFIRVIIALCFLPK